MITGKVVSVETRNLSEPTTAAASIGATTLYVSDASTFDETGGTALISGEQLAYIATDVDLNTITLAAALTVAVDDQALIEVYPATPVKTALVNLGDDGDSVPATVPHNLLEKFPDGIRIDSAAESVTLEQRGSYEWVLVDVMAEPLQQVSLDFVQGEEGYGFDASASQVQDLAVLGELGVAAGSFDSLTVGGQDIASTLSTRPRGTLFHAFKGATGLTGAGEISSTELRLFEANFGLLEAGRTYEHVIHFHFQRTVANDLFTFRLRATYDGSEALVTASSIQRQLFRDFPNNQDLDFTVQFTPPGTAGTLVPVRVALTGQRNAGTGIGRIYLASADLPFTWDLKDGGSYGQALNQDALSQKAKSDGSGSDNPPTSQFVKTFESTWGQSYFPGGDPYSTLPNADILWCGYDSTWGAPVAGVDASDIALIGFDYTAIMAALSSSSTMQKCELLYRGRYRKVATGLDVKFITHDYSSFPGVIDPYNITGSPNTHLTFLSTTALNIANNADYATDLGVTVGNQFKAGTRRGAGIIGQDLGDDSRGHIYGLNSVNRPKLRFTYLGTG